MAQYGKRLEDTFIANADMTTMQHFAVDCRSYGSVGDYVGQTLGNGASLGILENKPNAVGRSATVTVFGVTRAKVGIGVIPGYTLSSANSGYLTRVTSGGYQLATALSHTASGFMATVLVNHGGFMTTSVATD